MADQKRQFAERARSLENQTAILTARIEQSTKEIEGREEQESGARVAAERAMRRARARHRPWPAGALPKNRLWLWNASDPRRPGELGAGRRRDREAQGGHRRARHQIQQTSSTSSRRSRSNWRRSAAHDFRCAREGAITQDVLTRMEVRAPRKGIVQALKVHTVGAVVRPGDMLAEVVPEGDILILAARVSPLDIQAVSGGLRAEVRFPAFSTLQPPTIFGQIESISAASVIDETDEGALLPGARHHRPRHNSPSVVEAPRTGHAGRRTDLDGRAHDAAIPDRTAPRRACQDHAGEMIGCRRARRPPRMDARCNCVCPQRNIARLIFGLTMPPTLFARADESIE